MLIKPGPSLIKPDYKPVGSVTGDATGAGFASITPSATANTKGSYSQLIASTAEQARSIVVAASWNPAQVSPGLAVLLDIATGAGGSETVVIPNLCLSVPGQFNVGAFVQRIPLSIPAGTRISARCQVAKTSSTDKAGVKVTLIRDGFGANGIDSLNASTSTSLGTAITPGNGSKSAYVQAIASTARAYKGIFWIYDDQGAAGGNYNTTHTDVATGAAASEVIFYQDYSLMDFNGQISGGNGTCSPYVPINIPASTRIAFRAQNVNGVNVHGMSFYGVY